MHLDLIRDPSTLFPDIASPIQIRSLRIWHCKYKSLIAVGAFLNVEELEIASFPDSTLEVIAPLIKLRYLSILHMPRVSKLNVLSEFVKIDLLSLSTSPGWDPSGRCSVVKSLEPIAKMRALKHLELFGVRPTDKSLAPLEQCKNLQSARFSHYPKDEVERFYRATRVSNAFNPKPSFKAKS